MYCKKCGKEISEDAKFCGHCGAVQGAASSPGLQNSKKNKKGIMVPVLIGVVVMALAMFGQWAAKSMQESDGEDSASKNIVLDDTIDSESADETSSGETEAEAAEEVNPEYEKIFADRFIVQGPTVMMGDTASFAKVGEDGTIECLEFGSKDDVIHTMVQTLYIDISGLSDEQRQAVDESVRGNYSAFEDMEFVTVTSNIGNNYYTISCKVEGLDDEDTLQAAEDCGVVETTGSGGLMSMNLTGIGLRSDGYVEK